MSDFTFDGIDITDLLDSHSNTDDARTRNWEFSSDLEERIPRQFNSSELEYCFGIMSGMNYIKTKIVQNLEDELKVVGEKDE